MISLIGWVLFGLVAGAIARMLHPGYETIGMVGTILLGIVGSLVGGGIAYLFHLGTSPYEPAGWILSIIGAIVVLSMGFSAPGSGHPEACRLPSSGWKWVGSRPLASPWEGI